MQNVPPQEILDQIPRLYATEKTDLEDKIIHLHFFIGGCDWYVAEFDGEDIFFGFVNLNDPGNAEWGYFTFSELRETKVKAPVRDHDTKELIGYIPLEIEWDEHWTPKLFSEVEQDER